MVEFKKMFGNRVYIVSAFTLIALFAFLSTIPGVSISCEDKVCNELNCEVHCSVWNKGSRSIYLYNKGDWTIDFSPNVSNFDLYVKYYGKWKYTNFTMKTRLGNIPEDRKYVFVFPKYSKKEFKMIVDLADADKVKYTFGTLDPILVGWLPIYEYETKRIEVANRVIIEFPLECGWVEVNQTTECTGGYNISRWVTKEVDVNVSTGKQLGIKAGGKDYFGNVNIEEDKLAKWIYPIGDRNFEEFGLCRKYEKDKGVCSEVDLLE